MTNMKNIIFCNMNERNIICMRCIDQKGGIGGYMI